MTTDTRPESRTNHSKADAIPSGRWRIVSRQSRVGFRVKDGPLSREGPLP